MDGNRIEDLKTAYSEIEKRGIQEYSFGDFVNILKPLEPLALNVPEKDDNEGKYEIIDLNGTIVTTNSSEVVCYNEPVIDFAGLFICPPFQGNILQAIVVTVSNETRTVPIELIDPWLETVNRNTAFFNREFYLERYFERLKPIELVKLVHWKDNLWRLGVIFSGGEKIRETLIESKLHGGLPQPS